MTAWHRCANSLSTPTAEANPAFDALEPQSRGNCADRLAHDPTRRALGEVRRGEEQDAKGVGGGTHRLIQHLETRWRRSLRAELSFDHSRSAGRPWMLPTRAKRKRGLTALWRASGVLTKIG